MSDGAYDKGMRDRELPEVVARLLARLEGARDVRTVYVASNRPARVRRLLPAIAAAARHARGLDLAGVQAVVLLHHQVKPVLQAVQRSSMCSMMVGKVRQHHPHVLALRARHANTAGVGWVAVAARCRRASSGRLVTARRQTTGRDSATRTTAAAVVPVEVAAARFPYVSIATAPTVP